MRNPEAPLDINTDPIMVVGGGAIPYIFDETMPLLSDCAPVWCTLIPEKLEGREADPRYYPREREFRILHAMYVGTVAEIAAQQKVELEQAFTLLNTNMMINEAGECPQTKVLNEYRKSNNVSSAGKASRETLIERQDRRNKMTGFTPRQDAWEQLALKQVVGQYYSRRYPGKVRGFVPTDSPEAVQELIDALTVLRDDRIACDKQQAAPTPKLPRGGFF